MNKKLRSLCRKLGKKKVVSKPLDEEEPTQDDALNSNALLRSQNKDVKTEDTSNPRLSDAERRRRLITSFRKETDPQENLSHYDFAKKEEQREVERKLLEEKKEQRKKRLEKENSLRLEKNVFNVLALFKSEKGVVNNPKVLNSFSSSFKFDVDKVMNSKPELEQDNKDQAKISKKDFEVYQKEFESWIEDNNQNLKKRHYKCIEKNLENDKEKEEYGLFTRDFRYPCLYRISKLNHDKKNKLWEKIKSCEEEYNFLHKDILTNNAELTKIRKKKAEVVAQSLVNELQMKISGEMYGIHFQSHLEEKKRKAEAKAQRNEEISETLFQS